MLLPLTSQKYNCYVFQPQPVHGRGDGLSDTTVKFYSHAYPLLKFQHNLYNQMTISNLHKYL